MRYLTGLIGLVALAAPATAQQVVQAPDGRFICDGEHPRCTWVDQSTYPYFQFGGQHVGQFSGVSDVLEDGPPLLHYQSFLSELISYRPDTNAVALWADAQSSVHGGRVWGGFLSARSGFSGSPAGADSQLIGLEIDVLNGGLPGIYPNASKVGLQIVGFGNLNTNAIEILTETPGAAFVNAINIQPNTIAPIGTVLGMAPQNAALGINFLGSSFSDAAFLVSENQRLVFRSTGLGDAAIWRDDINNGSLVLQAAPAGLRVVNSQNSANLFVVTPTGDLVTPYGTFSSVIGRLNFLEQAGAAPGGIGGNVSVAINNTDGATVPSAAGSNSLAVAPGAAATGANSTAVGNNSAALAASTTAVGVGAQASGPNSVAIGANSSDGGEANVVSVGSQSQTRRITNVSQGVAINDAVNLGQLNEGLASSRAYTDSRVNELSSELGRFRRDAKGATASAMALSSIPQTMEKGGGMVGFGVGTWGGETGYAVGASKATDDGRVVFKAGATFNSRGQGGANGGVGFAF